MTMVTGNEYIFDNIDQALEYVLEMEQKTLAADIYRSKPPIIIRPDLGMHPIPVDSLDYPLGAWFNNEADDKFVMTRLMSGRYSLKPNLSNRKILFRGESEFHNPCKPNLFRNNKKTVYGRIGTWSGNDVTDALASVGATFGLGRGIMR